MPTHQTNSPHHKPSACGLQYYTTEPFRLFKIQIPKKHWKFQKSIGNSQKALEIPKKQGNSKKALEIPKKHWKFQKSIGNSLKALEIPKKQGNSQKKHWKFQKSLGMALCNVHILLRMEYLKYSVLSHLGKAFDPVYLEMTK